MTTPTRENEMEDKELLELAAKAAGMEIGFGKWVWWPDAESYTRKTGDSSVEWWNPLNDDGDALRLAVKLGMTIEQFDDDGGVVVTHGVSVRASEDYADDRYAASRDPYAATRRAIVRAAAEIGKSLPAREGGSDGR